MLLQISTFYFDLPLPFFLLLWLMQQFFPFRFNLLKSDRLGESEGENDFKTDYWSFSKAPLKHSLMHFESSEFQDMAVIMFNLSLIYAGLESGRFPGISFPFTGKESSQHIDGAPWTKLFSKPPVSTPLPPYGFTVVDLPSFLT